MPSIKVHNDKNKDKFNFFNKNHERQKENKEINNYKSNVDFSILLDVEKTTETKIIIIQAKPK